MLKSISVYRSSVTHDYSVCVELHNGREWVGSVNGELGTRELINYLFHIAMQLHVQTPGQPPVTHKETND